MFPVFDILRLIAESSRELDATLTREGHDKSTLSR